MRPVRTASPSNSIEGCLAFAPLFSAVTLGSEIACRRHAVGRPWQYRRARNRILPKAWKLAAVAAVVIRIAKQGRDLTCFFCWR